MEEMIGILFILLDAAIAVAIVVLVVKGLQWFRKWMVER